MPSTITTNKILEEFEKNIDKLDENAKNIFKQILDSVGNSVVGVTKERVFRGVTPTGQDFKPLAPLTIALRRNKQPPYKPLIDNRTMVNSLHSIVDLNKLEVKILAGVNYLETHQFGGWVQFKTGKKYVPARPVLDLDNQDKMEDFAIEDAIEQSFNILDKFLQN